MLWIIYDAHGYDFAEILYVCAKKRSLRYHKHCKVRLPGNNSHILRKYFSSLKNQFPIILDTVFFSWWKLYYVRPRFTGKTCIFRVSRFERYFPTNFEVLKNHTDSTESIPQRLVMRQSNFCHAWLLYRDNKNIWGVITYLKM